MYVAAPRGARTVDRQQSDHSVVGNGSYGKSFSPPRACALRNGRGSLALPLCSSADNDTWMGTRTSSSSVCPSNRRRQPMSTAATRGTLVLSMATGDYILPPPDGPPGPCPSSSRALRRWASDVPWSIPSRKRLVHRPACRFVCALKSHLFHRCRLEETASGALLLTERS